MRQFQAGDVESFKSIFDRHSQHILNFSFRYLHSRTDAEDVTQEVFLRIHRGKDDYSPNRPFRPWLFTIASRLLSNRVRDIKRRPQISLDSADPDATHEAFLVPDRTTPEPAQAAEVAERAAVVRKALNGLPNNQRIALLLCRFDGFSYEQIAEMMETTVSAVKALLYRAHQTLKQTLPTDLSRPSR